MTDKKRKNLKKPKQDVRIKDKEHGFLATIKKMVDKDKSDSNKKTN